MNVDKNFGSRSSNREIDWVYIPPYPQFAKGILDQLSPATVTVSKEFFEILLKALFLSAGFDAAWYRKANPDVDRAISDGKVENELTHLVRSGYPEGRLPCVFDVDETWYRQRYPDIDQAISSGAIATGHHHFNSTGFFEGRYPTAAAEEWGKRWSQSLASHVEP